MFPNQVSTLARLYARELNERPRQHMQVRRGPRSRGQGTIRKNAGWTLVQIGLRIAAQDGR